MSIKAKVSVTLQQAQALVEVFGGDGGDNEFPTIVCVGELGGGLVAWFEDYPEEGCIPLDEVAAAAEESLRHRP